MNTTNHDLNPLATGFYRRASSRMTPAALTVLACLMAASCAPQSTTSGLTAAEVMPKVGPKVSYTYRNNAELLNANQNAAAYCSHHQSIPSTRNFSTNSDGSNSVDFECLHVYPMPSIPPRYNPNLGYNYVSEQELADAAAAAQLYCMSNGLQKLNTVVSTTSSGDKAVSFQCIPR